jgi:hypothetical protein
MERFWGLEMKMLQDFRGMAIRLTDERLAHILEHPEMAGMEAEIGWTLRKPEMVVESLSDSQAHLYYRYYMETRSGGKYLCVVVKIGRDDAFVLTAYLTDAVKRGKQIWPNEK